MSNTQSAEAARINKPQLPARGQLRNGVGVLL